MKETRELLDAIVNTGVQGIESFSDGFQFIDDVPDFIDEALSWPNAIRGLEAMRGEAVATSPEAIEEMFEAQRMKLLQANVNPMLAGTLVTNIKGIYYTYALIVQSGGQVIVNQKTSVDETT